MARENSELIWALRVLGGVLLFVVFLLVLGSGRASGDGELFPTPDPRCVNPPPQWQEGEPPWIFSWGLLRFCVPYRYTDGRPIGFGELAGCGMATHLDGAKTYSTWIQNPTPGEVISWQIPSVVVGVQSHSLACAARRGATGQMQVSRVSIAAIDFRPWTPWTAGSLLSPGGGVLLAGD